VCVGCVVVGGGGWCAPPPPPTPQPPIPNPHYKVISIKNKLSQLNLKLKI